MIRLEHLCKRYESAAPLTDVCVQIEKGDVISIIGPSGTGKSTLLRLINLLERPTSGEIWLDEERITAPGYDVTKARRRMGMVFQQFNLFEHLTAVENVMVAPVELLGMSRQEAYDQALDLLESVGLRDRAKSYPEELSGGQKQRVAIARAVAMHPDILLMDEPTSALDPKMIQEVQQVIQKLADQGTTMMIVTHEMEFARKVANRVFYMDQGVVYEQGSPQQVFENPQKPLTRAFIFKDRLFHMEFKVAELNHDQLLTNIKPFVLSNGINRAFSYRLSLVLEEVIMGSLLPVISANEQMEMEMVCLEEKGDVQLTLHYTGPELDALSNADDLTLKLINAMTTDRTMSYEDGVNAFECTIVRVEPEA